MRCCDGGGFSSFLSFFLSFFLTDRGEGRGGVWVDTGVKRNMFLFSFSCFISRLVDSIHSKEAVLLQLDREHFHRSFCSRMYDWIFPGRVVWVLEPNQNVVLCSATGGLRFRSISGCSLGSDLVSEPNQNVVLSFAWRNYVFCGCFSGGAFALGAKWRHYLEP